MLALVVEDRGAGWSDLRICNGADQLTLEWISDINDPWGDLARAALVIVTGGFETTVKFEFEPQMMSFAIERGFRDEGAAWINRPRIRIFDRGPHGKLNAGHFFETKLRDTDEFGQAVLKALYSLSVKQTSRTSFGSQGFPHRAMHALDAALTHEQPA